MPRYVRANATVRLTRAATTHATIRTTRLRTVPFTISAVPHQSASVAAMWPEGKLLVDGVESRRGTSGRGRSTTALATRKTVSSKPSAPTRKSASRQRCSSTSAAATSTSSTTTGNVLAMNVATLVTWFQNPTRWSASQRLMDSSHRPWPSDSTALVSRSPMAVMLAASTAHAATYPPATVTARGRPCVRSTQWVARSSDPGRRKPTVFVAPSVERWSVVWSVRAPLTLLAEPVLAPLGSASSWATDREMPIATTTFTHRSRRQTWGWSAAAAAAEEEQPCGR